jgi:uridine phosphorylase
MRMKLFSSSAEPINTIPESELILNKDGSVYHLNLLPEHIADTIITVGDPGRVHKITQYFDDIDFEMNKREFITQTGKINNKRVTVISSGMGTDNVEILMTELDALVNIDLKKRRLKDQRKTLNIIRIGTSGSLQGDIPIDSHVVNKAAVGLDTLMCFYHLPQSEQENKITGSLQKKLSLPFQPYCVSGSEELKTQFAGDMIEGNAVTCPGFYAPQGRRLRFEPKIGNLINELNHFHEHDFWLTNFEMETAGYYALGRLMGHQMLSLNAIVANRITNQFSKDAEKTINALIKKVLERL